MYFPYDFLSYIFFSVACFIVRIQYITHITYKLCVNCLFMVLERHNSRLLVVKFFGSQKLCVDFQLWGGWCP